MFWSNWAKSPQSDEDGWIERAWMNGNNRTKIVTNVVWPMGLTVDAEGSFLYWVDANSFKVERIGVLEANTRKV